MTQCIRLLSKTPNNQLHRSVNSRLRRLSPPGELGRWAAASRWRKRLAGSRIVTEREFKILC